MRIISQLGMDFPYEQIVIFIDDNCVKCIPVSDMSSKSYLLGQYETEERAKKVFNRINEAYSILKEYGSTPLIKESFYMPYK